MTRRKSVLSRLRRRVLPTRYAYCVRRGSAFIPSPCGAGLQAGIKGVPKPRPHLFCVTNMIVHSIDVPTASPLTTRVLGWQDPQETLAESRAGICWSAEGHEVSSALCRPPAWNRVNLADVAVA